MSGADEHFDEKLLLLAMAQQSQCEGGVQEMEENIKESETEKKAPEDREKVIAQSGKRSHEGNEEPLMKVARTDSVISARSIEISALSKENKKLKQRLLEIENQKDENLCELRALRTLSAQSYLDKLNQLESLRIEKKNQICQINELESANTDLVTKVDEFKKTIEDQRAQISLKEEVIIKLQKEVKVQDKMLDKRTQDMFSAESDALEAEKEADLAKRELEKNKRGF